MADQTEVYSIFFQSIYTDLRIVQGASKRALQRYSKCYCVVIISENVYT
jgi:hypothetical protein